MKVRNEKERNQLARKAMYQRRFKVSQVRDRIRLDPEYRQTTWITWLHSYAENIINRKDPEFKLRRLINGLWKIDHNYQGLRLLLLLEQDFQSLRDDFPNYQQSPYFEAMASVAQRVQRDGSSIAIVLQYARQSLDEASARGTLKVLEFISKCLSERIKAATQRYYNFCKNATVRHARLYKRLYAAMRKRRYLTILRLDTSYADWVDQATYNLTETADGLITPRVLTRHRAAFGEYLNERFGPALLDYFGVTEYGKDRQWHTHWLVILDAAKHQSDILLAKELGEHWKKAITGGLGHYWNCNANKSIYTHLAIGKVDINSESVRTGLRFIIAYFTLAGMFMKLDLPENMRAFCGMINRLKPSATKARGKPSACLPWTLYGTRDEDLRRISWM